MKHMMWTALLALAIAGGTTARAGFDPDVGQAIQSVVDDARANLAKSPIPAGKGITVLMIAGDSGGDVENRLKSAVTQAGKTYVENTRDAIWEGIMREVEDSVRKGDILSESTLAKFGDLRQTQLLLYGTLRAAEKTDRRVYAELELHLTDVATKKHIWGGVFSKRYYLPGAVEGIVDLKYEVKEVLDRAIGRGAEELKKESGNGRWEGIKNVVLTPIAGDLDGYVLGKVEGMFNGTQFSAKRADVATLGEARALLRDQPTVGDAVAYGALRDLSRRLYKEYFFKTEYEIVADVQVAVQSAKTGDVLWSGTLLERGIETRALTAKEAVIKYRTVLGYAAMGLVVLLALWAFRRVK